jgi:CRP/FNR family transcriptional regulator
LPLTRAEIADFLGLIIETISRQLTKLKADNVIQIESREWWDETNKFPFS